MKGINDGQFNILPLGGPAHRLLSPCILLRSRMRADRVTQRSVLFRVQSNQRDDYKYTPEAV